MNLYVKKIERTYLCYFMNNLLLTTSVRLLSVHSYFNDSLNDLEYIITYKSDYEVF